MTIAPAPIAPIAPTSAASAPAAPVHHALLGLGRQLGAAGYRHTAVSGASHQHVLRRTSAHAVATLNDVFGLSRQFSAGDLPAPVWQAMNEAGIVRRDGASWRSALRVASLASVGAGEPLLFFHSAYPMLDDDAIFFDPDTYRFARALRAALRQLPAGGRRALDMGCGAGAGAVLIARHWPGAEVLAVDPNGRALALAAVNAELAGAAGVRTVRADSMAGVDGLFDLIVAHPPYLLDPCGRVLRHGGGVHGEQRSFELVRTGLARLAPGGRLLLYAGVAITACVDPLLARLAPLLDGSALPWRYEEIETDIHGDELAEPLYDSADRIAAIWLEVRRPA